MTSTSSWGPTENIDNDIGDDDISLKATTKYRKKYTVLNFKITIQAYYNNTGVAVPM